MPFSHVLTRHRLAACLVSTAAAGLNGCSDLGAGEGLRHPIETNVLRPIAPVVTLQLIPDRRLDRQPPPSIASLAFAEARTPFTGLRSGPASFEFGLVRGLTEDLRHDQVIVLDGYSRQLHLFAVTGDHIGSAGGAGAGPGLFLRPQAIHLAPDGRLLVFERTGTTSVFDVHIGRLTFDHRFDLHSEVRDACVIEDRIYVHGRRGNSPHVIHVFTLDGDFVRSFAEVYRTDNIAIRGQVSAGRMACSATAASLYLSPLLLGEVRAYSLDGDLTWSVRITGFLPLDLRELRRGMLMKIPENEYHDVTSVLASPEGDRVLLQVTTFGGWSAASNRPIGPRKVHTWLIRVDGLREEYHTDQIRTRIWSWSRSHYWVEDTDQFPRMFAVAVASIVPLAERN